MVIVNTSSHGCHALLLTSTGVQVVNLPDLTHQQTINQANALLNVLAHVTHSEQEKDTVFGVLGWLWDTVAEPVLTSLGHTSPPAPDATWPRIWWCPTGPLTLLPLHAAGHLHRSNKPASTAVTVSDRVISSYTPTLTALLRARTAHSPTGRPRLLAIGMPTTPGAGDLPAVPAELDRIHARYPITTRLQSPTRHQHHGPPPDLATPPTTTRVLAELPQHALVHLSCHGSQHFTDPTASAFWLTDGPLCLTDLIEQHYPGPRELAFLSACQTATGSPRALDEAIHLAAAMQLLGYRHVIATLWSIPPLIRRIGIPTVRAVVGTFTKVDEDDRQDRPTAVAVAVAVADHPNTSARPAGRVRVEPDGVNIANRFVRPPRRPPCDCPTCAARRASSHQQIQLQVYYGRTKRYRKCSAIGDPSAVDVNVPVSRYCFEHPAVVRDQQQRARVRRERRLELLDGRQIEVVGRLVQDQQVHPARLQQGQRGPGALAGRQRRRAPQDVPGAQSELRQQGPRVGRQQAGRDAERGEQRLLAEEQATGLVDLADDHAGTQPGAALIQRQPTEQCA